MQAETSLDEKESRAAAVTLRAGTGQESVVKFRIYRKVSPCAKTRNGTAMRGNERARVNMPTENLIAKFNKAGFVRNDAYGKVVAKALTSMVNLDHATIIQFFNSKINGLVNYYTFAANRFETQKLI